jgi:hypothetical protein
MMNEKCDDHKEHCFRLKNTEDGVQLLWKEINDMKKWVIAGMGGLLMQVVIFIGAIALVLMQK